MNNANLFEYGYVMDPLDEFFESFDTNPELIALDEISYQQRAEKAIFSLEVLDIEKYVKVNELKPVTNPTFFNISGLPTTDGLLSNEIFGITQKDRAGTFAYIDLNEYFIDPSCYKTLGKLDNKFKEVVSGVKTFSIDPEGQLVHDPLGNTGIKWLKDNFKKIVFKKSKSRTRDMRIRYIQHNYSLGRMFINKYVVIPAYYRDVNTSGRHTGVGQINTFYVHLITAANALKENGDYGLSMADTTCARIQNTIVNIYDWFCGNTNENIKDKGSGLGGKYGIIKANMGYTSDYSSRLVLSAPELKAESVDDLMVTMDKSAIPLAAIAADFFPFILFHIRKFFENEFLNVNNYEFVDAKGNILDVELDNPMLHFTDDFIVDNVKKFVYSHDTRFIPIEIPTKDKDHTYYMMFKGKRWDNVKNVVVDTDPGLRRRMTWVDIIYIAAKKSTEGKQMSFTRYPYDSYFNTIYTGIEVNSTTETEQILFDGELYKFYPKIRESDIGSDKTGAKFVDTMQVSNLYLGSLAGDYDGDTGQVKGSFFTETNDEIEKFRNSNSNFINAACENNKVSEKEAIQAMFNFTLILRQDKDKITNPVF